MGLNAFKTIKKSRLRPPQCFQDTDKNFHTKGGDGMAKLLEAARSNDKLQTLKELRDMLAERLEQSKSDRDVAAMARRLMQCVVEITEIEEEQKRQEEMKGGFIERMRGELRVTYGDMVGR